MEKYNVRYVLLALCVLSALLGISLGYLVFGPIQASAMAGRESLRDSDEILYDAELASFSFHIDEMYHTSTPEFSEEGHRYLVTAQDGYIVVYDLISGGKIQSPEVTSTTIDSLDPEEQARLLGGIRVYTDEALVRILEDYGS